MQCIEAAERHGAALHVGVHVEHALVRLEVRAAGVETHAFADETHRRCGGAARPVRQMHDARIVRGIGARDGKEGPAPRRRNSFSAVESVLQAKRLREVLGQAPVGGGVQRVRRQRGEPAGDIVAGGGRERADRGPGACRLRQYRCVRGARRGFGLLLKVAKRNAAASSAATAASNAAAAAAGSQPCCHSSSDCGSHSIRLRASLPAACSRSKVLACTGRQATSSAVSACAPTLRRKLSPALRTRRA